jgi:hypothetical protein
MDQLFQLHAADVVELIGGHHFNICQEKCRLEPRASDALIDAEICYTDFVDQVTVCRDNRVFRITSQHIDRARCLIILCVLVREEWTGNRIGDPSACFVLRSV